MNYDQKILKIPDKLKISNVDDVQWQTNEYTNILHRLPLKKRKTSILESIQIGDSHLRLSSSVEILWNGVNERLTPTESECQFIDLKTNLRQQSGIWSRKYSWVFNFSFHFLFTFTSLNRRMEYKIRHPRFAKIKIIASRYVKYTTANEKRKK